MNDQNYILKKITAVVDAMIHMEEYNHEFDKTSAKDMKNQGIIARDQGIQTWDWPQGIGLMGLLELQTYFGDNRYGDFLKSWFQNNIALGLPASNVNTTIPYMVLLGLTKKEPDEFYNKLCVKQAEWLMKQLPRVEENGFQHVTSSFANRNEVNLHEGEVWIDTLFMAVLFLDSMGLTYHETAWIEEARYQFLFHIKYLCDRKTGLFYHGWNFKKKDNFGEIFWCRGNGWFTLGAVMYLVNHSKEKDTAWYSYILETWKTQVKSLTSLQQPSGLWNTVLDSKDADNYTEVSGSAAITTGILIGIRHGLLQKEYQKNANKALHAILQEIQVDGIVSNVSAGTGVGLNAEHYKKIVCMPMAYGQSLVLLMLVEILRST